MIHGISNSQAINLTNSGQELKRTSIWKFKDIYKVYFRHLEGQRSKEIVTEGRERPVNFVLEKSDFAIDFDVLYTVKSIPAEGVWIWELQKYYALYRCNKGRYITMVKNSYS